MGSKASDELRGAVCDVAFLETLFYCKGNRH